MEPDDDDGAHLRRTALLAAPWILVTWIAIIAVILACCGPVGCTDKRQPAKDPAKAAANQAAAEADSGMAAAKAFLRDALAPELACILDGSAAFTRATMGKDKPPSPTWTVERIVADPVAFRDAGLSAERHANGTWNLWALGVGLMAAAPFLLYAAKFIPGCGPLIESVGTGLWTTFARRATKDQERARDTVYAHTATMWQAALSALPPGMADTLVAKVPVEVHAAIMQQMPPAAPPAPTPPPVA